MGSFNPGTTPRDGMTTTTRKARIPVGTWLAAVLLGARVAAQPVLHEIHYAPPGPVEPAEFVELHNPGGAAWPLGGWSLSGGIDFRFPAGTVLAAGGYLVVAQDPDFARTRFGAEALGPWTGRLRNSGDTVELRDPAGTLVDRVEYQRGFPWPTVGLPPGNSIELVNPALDNDLGGHWRASSSGGGGSVPAATWILAQARWRYFKGTTAPSAPGAAWRGPGFDDSSWEEGALPIGYDPSLAFGTRLDDMSGAYTSVYLRRRFTVTEPAAVQNLELVAVYDDGFKVWVNGQHLLDVNIAPGEVPHTGVSGPARESNDPETFSVALPPGLLRAGENVIAVQAHNVSRSGSSDFFFDATVRGTRGATGQGPTPGRANVARLDAVPPAIRQVEHRPESPRSGQPVVIQARITDPDGVGAVTLAYQVVTPGAYLELADAAYETDWTSVPMNDAGRDGDEAAGDGVFAATVPAPAQAHRNLVRYRITAADLAGTGVRVPYADDPEPNFAYFVHDGVPAWTGAVRPGDAGALGRVFTVAAEEMNRLPVLHLLAKRTAVEDSTWFRRYGGEAYLWSGTLVFNGRVYDHIRYRARGGVWRYAMTKNMWKFDFNTGHDFRAVDDWGRELEVGWTKLNLGASIQQGDYNHRGEQGMFESVGFRVFQLAGVPAVKSAYVQFRVVDAADEAPAGNQYDGDFWGVYLMLEQPDGRFLEEHGLPDGNLYKMESGTGDLNNAGPAGPLDKSDLNEFLGAYSGSGEAWWRERFEVANYLSYQTVAQAIHHYDICYDKNFFYYLQPQSGRWQVIPWDLDLTWAENMYDPGCGGVDRIKERLIPNATRFPAVWREWQNRIREFRDLFWNSDEAFRLIDEQAGRLRGPATGPTILDADRAQWDYNPKMADVRYSSSGNKAGQGRYYAWPNYSAGEISRDFDGAIQILKRYVGFRATNAAARARALDLLASDAAIPPRPTLQYAGPAAFPVNALRFRRTSGAAGTAVKGVRWRIGEVTPRTQPSWASTRPWKYELEPAWESGLLSGAAEEASVPPGVLRVGSHYRARVQIEDVEGRTSRWSEPVEFPAGAPTTTASLADALRVTELMYNAANGATNDFLELHNAGTTTLDLGGARFTQGVDFTFPAGATLAPGAYGLVVRAPATGGFAAFRAVYGLAATVPIFGPYSGNFADAGETVVLRDAAGGTDLVAFTYADGRGWPLVADGVGHSLVPRKDFGRAASGALDFGGNWRASAFLGGSPGRADPEPDTRIVINEIVAHTDFLSELDSNDWVELYNRGDAPITLGAGWYLSDDPSNPKRWAIPATTTIPARGWRVLEEVTGFNNPRGTGFSFDKAGEQVLISHYPAGSPGRVVDAVDFRSQENDWSLARVPDGGEYWDHVFPRTPLQANAAPQPRVVIGELLYHEGGLPTNRVAAALLEYVEVHNAMTIPVDLDNTNGVWRLGGGIAFEFPPLVRLAAGERVLVVPFNPSTTATELGGFRQTLGVPAATRIFGPYTGRLDNDTDRVSLERPQAPDRVGDPITWVLVDEVDYHDGDPWAGGADGLGRSYHRESVVRPGNDPANWFAADPTPGSGTSSAPVDADGDGLPDAWETGNGLNPNDPTDAGKDGDGDGATHAQEYAAGTDPRDAVSVLRILSVEALDSGELEIVFEALAGRAYVLEASDRAAGGTWTEQTRLEAVPGSDRVITISLPSAAGAPARFVRVRHP